MAGGTDFNLIKPGALHTANGGFLLIDVRKLVMQPIIREEIKRALFSNEIRIQGLTDALGFATTRTLQPQPVPLDVKIVLLLASSAEWRCRTAHSRAEAETRPAQAPPHSTTLRCVPAGKWLTRSSSPVSNNPGSAR